MRDPWWSTAGEQVPGLAAPAFLFCPYISGPEFFTATAGRTSRWCSGFSLQWAPLRGRLWPLGPLVNASYWGAWLLALLSGCDWLCFPSTRCFLCDSHVALAALAPDPVLADPWGLRHSCRAGSACAVPAAWCGGKALVNEPLPAPFVCSARSAGIGRTGTFIVIDILIDIIREKGRSWEGKRRPLLFLLGAGGEHC